MENNTAAAVSGEGPPYFYVRDKGMAAAHHWDYLNERADEALCGHGYRDPVTLGLVRRPRQVCRACQDRLPEYHAEWWSNRAEELQSELRTVRTRLQTAYSELSAIKGQFNELKKHSENQRKTLASLQKKQAVSKRTKQAGAVLSAGLVKPRPALSRLDEPDVIGEQCIQEGSDEVAAAGIAVMKASDAIRQLCRERSGAISHNDVIEALDKVMRGLTRTQRLMLKSEFRRYGSGLEWSRSELAALGRRMT